MDRNISRTLKRKVSNLRAVLACSHIIEMITRSQQQQCRLGTQMHAYMYMYLPTDSLLCKDCNCTNDSHKVALNQLYDDVVAAITMASQNSIHTHMV